MNDDCDETPITLGPRRADRLRPGLWVHSADVRDLSDITLREMQEESLRLVLVLDGEVDVSFGHRRLNLGATRGDGPSRPQAALIALREPELFERRAWRGKRERKISVVFNREWLAEACLGETTDSAGLNALFERHLVIERWTPTPRAVALAEQMIHPPPLPPLLRRLYLESRAIELAAEALHGFLAAPPPPCQRPAARRRAAALRELIDAGGADGLSLAEMARRVGCNADTLQKQFRAAFDMTIFDYLRRTRLLRARLALERDACSIIEAACLAGYTSPANFATAFKRQFGVTPRQCRAAI